MKLPSTDLNKIHAQGLYRQRIATIKNKGYAVFYGKDHIDFTSNDYLGLRQHPHVKKRLCDAAMEYGFGSGASSMVSGCSPEAEHLEEEFAQFIGYPKALLFQSGYHANLAVTSVLCNDAEIIFADKLIHASIIDGLRLSSLKFKRFSHQNFKALIRFKQCFQNSYCITEGVFSMEGDITNLDNLYHITKKKHYYCR